MPIGKILLYAFLVICILFLHDLIAKNIITKVYNEYSNVKRYIDAIILFVLGWILLKMISNYVYKTIKKISDEGTGKIMKSLTEIIGFAVLLSLLASFLNISAAASLTLGSFIGMVFGFASQTILKNAIAGIFIAILKPVRVGDRVVLVDPRGKEREGTIKEIRLMYIVLENNGEEILIPSSAIIENTIRRKV